MPANLSAQFIKARTRFREAQTPQEKLAALEEMLATIPKHKGTDKMQADIKRRIAKVREAASSSGKKSRGPSYEHMPKEGAGQVVLVGPPNAGKSTLLSVLTNAKPEVATYPFSTIIPVPGMMRFEDIHIQLLDLPPIAPEYTEPWVYSLIRSADLAMVVLDASDGDLLGDELEELLAQLEERRIRLVPERDGDEEDRIAKIPTCLVLTQSDRASASVPPSLSAYSSFPRVTVSCTALHGLDELRRHVFKALQVVRVYTKLPGQKPDMEEPYTLPVGSQVLDAVRAIHREFADRLKYVRIWGSGRFDGQQVPSDHLLEDGDVIEVHLQKQASIG